MAKVAAILLVLVSFVLVAPVIESGTAPVGVLQAVGNAAESGGD